MTKNNNVIRDQNLQTLKRFLFKKSSALKAEMAHETGLSVVTINALVKQLVEEKFFIEGSPVQQSLGRPAAIYQFNYEKQHFLLLSIEESKNSASNHLILVGKIVNLQGTVIVEQTIDFSAPTMALLIETIMWFLNQDQTIHKIGLSLPGKVYHGVVLSSWKNVFDQWRIADELKKQSDVPIIIQNDAHLLTVGEIITQQLNREQTIVGIFYPINSMPGISIYAHNTLIEGGKNLAGEAKFLPFLIDAQPPHNEHQLMKYLLQILEIYNVVIAPDSFIISADSVSKSQLLEKIAKSSLLPKQVNQPNIYFSSLFETSMFTGLLWLVTKGTIYHI